MKTIAFCLVTVLIGVGLLALTGCGDDDRDMMNNDQVSAPKILRVSPSDGAANISRSAAIGLKFDKQMDTASVRRSFYLSGGPALKMWMDTLNHYGGMDNMMMGRDRMMAWMDSIMYAGRMEWNAKQDSCLFIVDSLMTPNSQHMIFMYGEMRDGDGMMMDMDNGMMGMGGMMGRTSGFAYHFTTAP